jgi:predicted Zn-dependent protease
MRFAHGLLHADLRKHILESERGGLMTRTDPHAGPMSLQDIRNDLEKTDLSGMQRKRAFEHLRRWLRERPDDAEAKELLARHEGEFGREAADMPIREARGEGFGALAEAEEQAKRAQ